VAVASITGDAAPHQGWTSYSLLAARWRRLRLTLPTPGTLSLTNRPRALVFPLYRLCRHYLCDRWGASTGSASSSSCAHWPALPWRFGVWRRWQPAHVALIAAALAAVYAYFLLYGAGEPKVSFCWLCSGRSVAFDAEAQSSNGTERARGSKNRIVLTTISALIKFSLCKNHLGSESGRCYAAAPSICLGLSCC
jgi:hypothetical protein